MRVNVVYESMFGNTKVLAQDVGEGLSHAGAEVQVIGVGEAAGAKFTDCDLLILAAPTHALSLSRPQTRADAVKKGADPAAAAVGIREWLGTLDRALPRSASRPPIAVFDTRVSKARRWSGSAAKRAARILRKAGFTVVEQKSFFVDGITGPVTTGEHLRAGEWGKHLALEMGHHAAS